MMQYSYKYNGIIKNEELKIVGVVIELNSNQKLNYQKVTSLWQNFNPIVKKIKKRKNGKDWVKYGISYDSDKNKTYKYLASIEVNEFPKQLDGLITKTIPAQDYLHFTHLGSMEYLIKSIYSIYKDWIPESNFKVALNILAGVNHIEKYDKRFYWTRIDSEIDILIPIMTH